MGHEIEWKYFDKNEYFRSKYSKNLYWFFNF